MGFVIFVLCIKKIEVILVSTYTIELSAKEMVYFFFKKKNCPICFEKMKRLKDAESLGEGIGSAGLGKYYYGERFKVTLYYKCNKCNRVYSIGELVEENKKE